MEMVSELSIVIPFQDRTSFVEIFAHELPEDPSDIIEVLKGEIAPLEAWLDVAVGYYGKADKGAFRTVLTVILDEITSNQQEIESYYDPNEFRLGLVKILNALGADCAVEIALEQDKSIQQELMEKAANYYSRAVELDNRSTLTWLGKAACELALGGVDREKRAMDHCNKVLEIDPSNVHAMLGKSVYHFNRKEYQFASALICRVMELDPDCPADVRVGLGMCCYKMGQKDRAKACMERALQLQPQNVDALVASAIFEMDEINLSSTDRENLGMAAGHIRNAVSKLWAAYSVRRTDSMALNHLANHYFWKWTKLAGEVKVVPGSKKIRDVSNDIISQFKEGDQIRLGPSFITRVKRVDMEKRTMKLKVVFKSGSDAKTIDGPPRNVSVYCKKYGDVEGFSRKAYDHTASNEVKAESSYILGRMYHEMGDFKKASWCYQNAVKLWPLFPLAKYSCAQMKIQEKKYGTATELLRDVCKTCQDSEEPLQILGLLYVEDALKEADKEMEIEERKKFMIEQMKKPNVDGGSKKRHEALEILKQALGINPRLIHVLLAQAKLLQVDAKEHTAALVAYEAALKSLREQLTDTSASKKAEAKDLIRAVLNNMGVLLKVLGALDDAEGRFKEVLYTEIPEADKSDSTANNMFWGWKRLPLLAMNLSEETNVLKVKTEQGDGNSGEIISSYIKVGDTVRVGEAFRGTVSEVGEDFLTVKEQYHPLKKEKDADTNGHMDNMVPILRRTITRKVPAKTVTTVFNLGMVYEDRGQYNAAVELYKAILDSFDMYEHCYLRLGCISRDEGDLDEAEKWFKKGLAHHPRSAELQFCMANLCGQKTDWHNAQKRFEHYLRESKLRHPYAIISLGNIYHSSIDDPAKSERHLLLAAQNYRRALCEYPNNIYAANGIGITLAESGHLEQAREIFTQVREVSADKFPNVWINLAHVQLGLGKHLEAINLYQTCLKKFYHNQNVRVLLYLAYAYYDFKKYGDSLRVLKKAIHHYPGNLLLWYNLGLAEENQAVYLMSKKDQRTLADVQKSMSHLRSSIRILKWLAKKNPDEYGKKLPYSISKCEARIKFSEETSIKNLEVHLQHEMRKQQQQLEAKQIQEKVARDAARRKKEEEDRIKKAREEEQQRLQKIAAQKMARLERMRQEWQSKEVAAESKAKRKRSGAISPDEDEGHEPIEVKKPGKKRGRKDVKKLKGTEFPDTMPTSSDDDDTVGNRNLNASKSRIHKKFVQSDSDTDRNGEADKVSEDRRRQEEKTRHTMAALGINSDDSSDEELEIPLDSSKPVGKASGDEADEMDSGPKAESAKAPDMNGDKKEPSRVSEALKVEEHDENEMREEEQLKTESKMDVEENSNDNESSSKKRSMEELFGADDDDDDISSDDEDDVQSPANGSHTDGQELTKGDAEKRTELLFGSNSESNDDEEDRDI